jgi:hypothetical protein
MSWPTVSPAMCDHASASPTVGAAADHGDEFHLPVDVRPHQLDVVERPGEGRRELGEGGGHGGHGHPRLLGVAAVVEPDREHLARARCRVAERLVVERLGRCRHTRRELDERVPVVVQGHDIRAESTAGGAFDVGDAVVEHQRGAAVVVCELHVEVPSGDGSRSWDRRSASSRAAPAASVAVP